MHTKLFKNALDTIWGSINKSTGLSHPGDMSKTVEMFVLLIDAGESAGQDEIADYLRSKGAELNRALEIQRVYEVLVLGQSKVVRAWKPDILDILRK